MSLPKTAKEALYEARYKDALVLLDAQLTSTPSDIEALCDRALCWYQLGLPQELHKDLDLAYKLLTANEVVALSHFGQIIFVAKLMEEKGLFSEALRLLQVTWNEPLTAKQSQMLRIQQLRLATEARDLALIKKLYASVIAGNDHSLNFEIEREHALMLADFVIMGFPQSMERYQLAMSHELCAADKSFLNSEILELAILSGHINQVRELELSPQSESEYEKIQSHMMSAFLNNSLDFEVSILRLEKVLSLMALLRILRQILILFPQSPHRSTRLERYKFYAQSISHKSTQENFLAPLYQNDLPEQIFADSDSQTLKINGSQKAIKSTLFWKLLPLFNQETTEISFDNAIKALYGELPNLQHFDRLRVSLTRVNKELEMHFNIKTVFKLSKTKLSLLIPIFTEKELRK